MSQVILQVVDKINKNYKKVSKFLDMKTLKFLDKNLDQQYYEYQLS